MTPEYIQARRLKRDRRVDRFLGQVAPRVADWLVRCIREIADGNIAVTPSTLYGNLYFGDVDGYTIRMSLNEKKSVLVILDITNGGG